MWCSGSHCWVEDARDSTVPQLLIATSDATRAITGSSAGPFEASGELIVRRPVASSSRFNETDGNDGVVADDDSTPSQSGATEDQLIVPPPRL